MRESDEKWICDFERSREKILTETICVHCGQSVGPNHYRNTDKGICEELNPVKMRAEKLLQDLLFYASCIQTKLEGTLGEDELESTAEALSSSLKELDVLPYL